MLTLMIRVDQVLSAWRVSALLYDVSEDGTRTLLSTTEDWLSEMDEHINADELTQTVSTALRWSVMTMQRTE